MTHLGVKGYYQCAKDAKDQGYEYFGMQAGQGKVSAVADCFGTNDLARAQLLGTTDTCSASVDIFGHPMGGDLSSYVYRTSVNGAVPTFNDAWNQRIQSQGCYLDTVKSSLRDMGPRQAHGCAAVAAELGYLHFAISGAGVCYVSNDLNQITAGGAAPVQAYFEVWYVVWTRMRGWSASTTRTNLLDPDRCKATATGMPPIGGEGALSVYSFQ